MKTFAETVKRSGNPLASLLFLLCSSGEPKDLIGQSADGKSWLYSQRSKLAKEELPEELARTFVKGGLVELQPDLQLPGISRAYVVSAKGEKNFALLVEKARAEKGAGSVPPPSAEKASPATAPAKAKPVDISEALASGAAKVEAAKLAPPAEKKTAPAKAKQKAAPAPKRSAAEKAAARKAKAPAKLKLNQRGNGREVWRVAEGGKSPKTGQLAPARDEYLSSVTVALDRARRYFYKFGLPCRVVDYSASPVVEYTAFGAGKADYRIDKGAKSPGAVQPPAAKPAPAKKELAAPKPARRGTKKAAPAPVKPPVEAKASRKSASSPKPAPAGKKAAPAQKAAGAAPAKPAKVPAPRTTRAKSAEEVRA